MTEVILIRGSRHVVWECRTCGALSTCPEVVYEEQRARGGFHHCPNGHQWGWNKDESEHARITMERDLLKQQIAQKDDEILTQQRSRRAAEDKADASEKKIKGLKRREAAGLCPCCNRSFVALRQHMSNKHPTFVAEEVGSANILKLPASSRCKIG